MTKDMGNVGRSTIGFQQAMIKDMANVGRSTIGFQQAMIKDMANVGRHTWISADNNKMHGKYW